MKQNTKMIILGITFLLAMIITATKRSEFVDVSEDLEKDFLAISSYEVEGGLLIDLGEDLLECDIIQYADEEKSFIEITAPEEYKGNQIIIEDDIVFTQNNAKKALPKEVEKLNFKDVSLLTFKKEYEKADEEHKKVEMQPISGEPYLVIEFHKEETDTKSTFGHKRIWVEEKSFTPLQIIVFDYDEEEIMRISYDEFKRDVSGDEYF